MSQSVHVVVGSEIETVELPDAHEEVLPGVRWGDTSLLLTPAWIARHAHIRRLRGGYDGLFRQGTHTLAEDVVFCLLGGFGVKAEVAEAAYRHLRAGGLFSGFLDRAGIERRLREPLDVGGRRIRYRFPGNRARYIAEAMASLAREEPPDDDLPLRDYLLRIPGIGPKTASFIVRNHLGSDRVAILDIHVLRAGRAACLFSEGMTLPRHYREIEALFLGFADACGVPASILDLIVWEMMRALPAHRRAAAAKLNRRYLPADGLPPVRIASYLKEQTAI